MAASVEDVFNQSSDGNEMEHTEDIDECAERIFQNFVDDLLLGVAFLVHYESRAEAAEEEQEANTSNAKVDVLGQPLNKVPDVYCDCPECGQNVAASRFAPHLAKCMGKGRASFRAASQKISGETSSVQAGETDEAMEDDYCEVGKADSDEEWLPAKKCDGRKRKSKGDPKNVYLGNRKDGKQAYEGMPYANKKLLLQKICGVVSNQTGKYCTRSMKCPHHTNEERSALRGSVLGQVAGTSTMGLTDSATFMEQS